MSERKSVNPKSFSAHVGGERVRKTKEQAKVKRFEEKMGERWKRGNVWKLEDRELVTKNERNVIHVGVWEAAWTQLLITWKGLQHAKCCSPFSLSWESEKLFACLCTCACFCEWEGEKGRGMGTLQVETSCDKEVTHLNKCTLASLLPFSAMLPLFPWINWVIHIHLFNIL